MSDTIDTPVQPVRGLAAGLGLFHVMVNIEHRTNGWSGSVEMPSMWTVGGNAIDAIGNARRLIGNVDKGSEYRTPDGRDVDITRVTFYATPALGDDGTATETLSATTSRRPRPRSA